MSRRERDKGRKGEREVAVAWEKHGLTVRGLEGTGDHLVVAGTRLVHCESKRQETARPWAWWEQATSEAPAGAIPVVAFRRSKSSWLAIVELDTLAELLAAAGG